MRLARVANFAGRYAYAAGFTAYVFTLGLLSAKRRFTISQLAREARYRDFPRPTLPRVEMAQCTSNETPVVLANPQGVEGNVTLLELLVLARLVRERRPRAIFEIGTFNGRTTRVLAENAPDDTTVYTLDLPADQAPSLGLLSKERGFVNKPQTGTLVKDSNVASKVVQLLGDSATFDFSPFSVDMVFIDGSHAFEYVLNDSRRCLSMLRDGRGLLVWHDYGEWEGVTRALNELSEDPAFHGIGHIAGTTIAFLEVP